MREKLTGFALMMIVAVVCAMFGYLVWNWMTSSSETRCVANGGMVVIDTAGRYVGCAGG